MNSGSHITPQKLNLTANGNFRVLSSHDNTNRCGPHGSPRTVEYTVDIGSSPEMLDSHGFIIDWQEIFMKVAHHFRYVDKFPPCELIAEQICDLVVGLLEGRCKTVKVQVGINGLPAHMTAEYSAV